MNIDFLTLCDFVSNNSGKLTIIDTFDDMYADKFPWRAYFGIAIKMSFKEKPKSGTFCMCIIEENNNTPIFQAETNISGTSPEKLVIASNIKGLIFETAGTYILKLQVDNKILRQHTFRVQQKMYKDEKSDRN